MEKQVEIADVLNDLKGHVAALNCLVLSVLPELPQDLRIKISEEWASCVNVNRTDYVNSKQPDGFLKAFDTYAAIIDSAISTLKQ